MATKEQLKPFFTDIYSKSDKIIEILLYAYFTFGIGLSFIYDTFLVGIGVGLLNLALYFVSKYLFPDKTVNQYIASLVAGLFMAQFIYQMHGLFEMHFTAFIAIIALMTYQNKYAFIPQLLFVVIHHSSFAYIQYLGYINEIDSYKHIYFTQLEFMDFTTFLFHAGLYAVGVVLAAIYTHNLEINTIKSAENIIQLQNSEGSMKLNIGFAEEIAEGKFESNYSLQEGDQMGAALVAMRDNLQKGAIREHQEKFINVGVAEIGDIIRSNNTSLEELSFQIVSYLVKYMKLNQGGAFIVMEDDNDNKYLELKGCYAYERKKYMDKKVEVGEGLIGQCYLERSTIYLKDVPKNYIRITSGLGDAPPSNLILVPIQNEDGIEGVMELASFRILEDYEIDFLKRVCENVATTITSAKINEKTKILYEQSQQQTEEMRAQEEEMRQNMEELSATQEEIERKSREFENRFSAISESSIGSIEFNLDGTIIDASDSFCELIGFKKSELIGSHQKIMLDSSFSESSEYLQYWKDVKIGNIRNGEFTRITKSGKQIELYEAYSIINDGQNMPSAILMFALNISSYKS